MGPGGRRSWGKGGRSKAVRSGSTRLGPARVAARAALSIERSGPHGDGHRGGDRGRGRGGGGRLPGPQRVASRNSVRNVHLGRSLAFEGPARGPRRGNRYVAPAGTFSLNLASDRGVATVPTV